MINSSEVIHHQGTTYVTEATTRLHVRSLIHWSRNSRKSLISQSDSLGSVWNAHSIKLTPSQVSWQWLTTVQGWFQFHVHETATSQHRASHRHTAALWGGQLSDRGSYVSAFKSESVLVKKKEKSHLPLLKWMSVTFLLWRLTMCCFFLSRTVFIRTRFRGLCPAVRPPRRCCCCAEAKKVRYYSTLQDIFFTVNIQQCNSSYE